MILNRFAEFGINIMGSDKDLAVGKNFGVVLEKLQHQIDFGLPGTPED